MFWSMFGAWKQNNPGGEPGKGTDQPTPTNHDLTQSKGNVGDPKLLVPRDKYFWIDFPIYHQNQLC